MSPPPRGALWGRVVTDPGYIKTGAAYEALSLEAFFIIGPGLAGVFAIAGCTLTGLALCAALMAVGTIGFCRSALVRRWPAPDNARSKAHHTLPGCDNCSDTRVYVH